MREIRMVDLKGQYDRIQHEVDQAIAEVIQSTTFINGPAVQKFSKEFADYLQVKHVIPCANGTDALQVAMMALDLKPGDEVITSTFTFIATVETIALLRLKPVLVDVDPHTFNLDTSEVLKAITSKTRAIIPVHLFGQCAPMDGLIEIAHKHNLFIIEDACQASGSEYISANGRRKKAGTIGEIGCTSFFPSKNLGCFGDGGALFTNDDTLAENIRSIVNHGMKIRYYHDLIGVNSRLDSIQAAILSVKLKYLDQYNAARIEAAEYYYKHLSDIKELTLPFKSADTTHIFHQFTLKVPESKRNQLQSFLAERHIPAMIYYPVPIHLQKAYEEFRHENDHFPVSEQLSKEVISLPMHTELDNEQLDYICKAIREFFQ